MSSIFNLLVFFSVFLCCNVYSKELNTGDYESAYSKGPYRNGYVTSREQAIFLNSIISVIKKGNLKSVKILDFGCGDGRHFSIIQKMHKLFPEVKISYLAYDPSVAGLKSFQKRLVDMNYQYNSKKDYIDNSKVPRFKAYRPSILTNNENKIKVILCHPSLFSTNEEILNLIGKGINVIISPYGSFNHIPKYQARLDIIKTLAKSLAKNGEIIIDMPFYRNFSSHLKKYNKLRAENNIKQLGLANEPGDIYFSDNIYYHISNF